MLLIVEPRGQRRTRTEAEGRHVYDRMLTFAAGLRERGLLHAAESLRDDGEGLRLQVRDGKQVLRDGPFLESKEMIGGFFLLACEDREQALAVARECPAAEWATVEVREVAPCYA
ncbi:YciI family protein [Oleiagrimonas soli]|nr:YciI family protein [Oleiagrimonas soli]